MNDYKIDIFSVKIVRETPEMLCNFKVAIKDIPQSLVIPKYISTIELCVILHETNLDHAIFQGIFFFMFFPCRQAKRLKIHERRPEVARLDGQWA